MRFTLVLRQIIPIFAVLAVAFPAWYALAQDGEGAVAVRHVVLFSGDSATLEYAYAGRSPAPTVFLLPDRYGVQVSTRQLMKSFTDAGYNACAMHLRTKAGDPERTDSLGIDSADVDRVIEVLVDVRNDERCSGKVGLLGFDVGATIGIRAESRVPLFAACALFYPSDRKALLDALARCNVAIEVNTGKQDTILPEKDVFEFKMLFGSKSNRMVFRYYDDAGRMFFNPGHPGYNAEAMQRGMLETSLLFRMEL